MTLLQSSPRGFVASELLPSLFVHQQALVEAVTLFGKPLSLFQIGHRQIVHGHNSTTLQHHPVESKAIFGNFAPLLSGHLFV